MLLSSELWGVIPFDMYTMYYCMYTVKICNLVDVAFDGWKAQIKEKEKRKKCCINREQCANCPTTFVLSLLTPHKHKPSNKTGRGE